MGLDPGPFDWKSFIPTVWMAFVAGLGGFISWLGKVRSGQTRAFNIMELLGEIVVSAFVGLVTYWICKGFAVNEYLTVGGVAISGHMGARAIFLLENSLEEKAKALVQK